MAKPTAANVAAIEAVEKLKPIPPALAKLLQKEGLDHAEIPQRGGKTSIERRLNKAGLLSQAKEWINAFTTAAKQTIPSKSSSTAREIAWRYVEEKAASSRDEWLQAVHIDKPADPDEAALPVDVYWVYRHPLLAATKGAESPALAQVGRLYEEEHPCPNNGARSRLNAARRDEKAIDAFMKHVDKIMATTSKIRQSEAAGRSTGIVELAEEEAIADLELRLMQEMEEKLMEFSIDAGDD